MFTLAVTIGRSMSYTSFGAKMEEIKTERVGMPVSNPGYLSRGLGGRGGGKRGATDWFLSSGLLMFLHH